MEPTTQNSEINATFVSSQTTKTQDPPRERHRHKIELDKKKDITGTISLDCTRVNRIITHVPCLSEYEGLGV